MHEWENKLQTLKTLYEIMTKGKMSDNGRKLAENLQKCVNITT